MSSSRWAQSSLLALGLLVVTFGQACKQEMSPEFANPGAIGSSAKTSESSPTSEIPATPSQTETGSLASQPGGAGDGQSFEGKLIFVAISPELCADTSTNVKSIYEMRKDGLFQLARNCGQVDVTPSKVEFHKIDNDILISQNNIIERVSNSSDVLERPPSTWNLESRVSAICYDYVKTKDKRWRHIFTEHFRGPRPLTLFVDLVTGHHTRTVVYDRFRNMPVRSQLLTDGRSLVSAQGPSEVQDHSGQFNFWFRPGFVDQVKFGVNYTSQIGNDPAIKSGMKCYYEKDFVQLIQALRER